MIIGADELIYRIRKNGGAKNIDNLQLGRKIVNLITSLKGSKYIPDQESYWDTRPGAMNVSELGLCKSSEQYKIDPSTLPNIYTTIDQW